MTDIRLENYALADAGAILTPALLIYPHLVDANIKATVKLLGGDPSRWRPHIKTAKLEAIIRRYIDHGIRCFKCSTTLELLTACQAGADDVLLAFAVTGTNAQRTIEISELFPGTRISVLIEAPEQLEPWRNTEVGIFVDINPGMNRTGVDQNHASDVVQLAKLAGAQFRGLHYYDGHVSAFPEAEREALTHQGYDHLLALARAVEAAGVNVEEIITSGTPAMPYGHSYTGFLGASFIHRVSPGTVVYNDTTSLQQLPDYGYLPAAIVLSTVISHPSSTRITCDAGHKSVSADAGVPTCAVIGAESLTPAKPSEEHLPIDSTPGQTLPAIGDRLYLIPRHVCPTVNNFDEALMIVDGRVAGVEHVSARGHESPLALKSHPVAV